MTYRELTQAEGTRALEQPKKTTNTEYYGNAQSEQNPTKKLFDRRHGIGHQDESQSSVAP